MGTSAGLIMAVVFNGYFIARAIAQPHLAPAYDVPPVPLRERISALRHVLLVGVLVFVVLGLIMTGTATPSESAALGAVAALIAVVLYRRFTLKFLRDVLRTSATTSGMILIIFVGSTAYSQLLAASGAGAGFVEWATSLPLDPRLTALAFVGIVFVLGLFIDAISIMLIAVPLFMPVIAALGLDPLWFTLLILMSINIGALTPPMGLQIFVLKGVRPDLDLAVIFRSVWPIVALMWLGILIFFFLPDLGYLLVPNRPGT
jgi:tripartite ATP-independent transporter DctM subunit